MGMWFVWKNIYGMRKKEKKFWECMGMGVWLGVGMRREWFVCEVWVLCE